MPRQSCTRHSERGGTLIEFTITAGIFFMMLIAITAGGHLFWTHNALVEATRRGARYAVTRATVANDPYVRNVVLYGTPDGTTPLVDNLTADKVTVEPSANFGVGQGSVSVSITGFEYNFVIPGISQQIPMPAYSTTLTGESAGTMPPP